MKEQTYLNGKTIKRFVQNGDHLWNLVFTDDSIFTGRAHDYSQGCFLSSNFKEVEKKEVILPVV